MRSPIDLPDGVVFVERDFPNANLLLLLGEEPALVDTGFASCANATAALAHEHAPQLSRVVNTHWHSDHVGGNALFQRAGAEIIGSPTDADALNRADPGCCLAEYLDQPVPRYAIDRSAADGDRLLMGDAEWDVLAIPGHTPGHLAFWNPAERLLAVGDALSSYDVGWVNVILDGAPVLDAAAASLTRLRELDAHVVLPGHGPAIADPDDAIAKAIDRIERQRADLGLTVTYGAKRVLAFALMIHGGMTPDELDAYVGAQAWAHDAAALLGKTTEEFTRDLVDPMLDTGALSLANGTVYATQRAEPPDPAVFDLPFPRSWVANNGAAPQ